MATVTSLGSGSGIDLEGLITNLMNAEKIPLTTLQAKESSFNSKISALGALKSKLASLQTAADGLKPSAGQTALNKFASFTATVADTSIASATASTGAVPGNYSIVVGKLAQAQRSVSAALPTPLAPAVGDSLSFTIGSDTTTITIDSSNNSLSGLRNSINSANIGVKATIVNGTDGAQLILTGEEGAAKAFTLGGSLASAFGAPEVAASDAEFTINGIAATSSSNKATGVLDGVTLNLTKLGTTTLTITQDNTANLTTALNAFITAANDANTLMKTQGAYDATTKKAGVLQGNSALRDAQNSLRGLIFNTTAGGTSAYQRLSDIGVGISADGTLKLDSGKLSAALAADPEGAAKVVAAVGSAFSDKLDSIVGTSGSIQTTTDGANKILKRLANQEEVLQRRLATIEAQYRKRFTSLDTLIAGMKQTSGYLAQQLANLPGASS